MKSGVSLYLFVHICSTKQESLHIRCVHQYRREYRWFEWQVGEWITYIVVIGTPALTNSLTIPWTCWILWYEPALPVALRFFFYVSSSSVLCCLLLFLFVYFPHQSSTCLIAALHTTHLGLYLGNGFLECLSDTLLQCCCPFMFGNSYFNNKCNNHWNG